MTDGSSSRLPKLLALQDKRVVSESLFPFGVWAVKKQLKSLQGRWRQESQGLPRPPGPSVINLWNNKHKGLYNQWQILFLLWQNPSVELRFYREITTHFVTPPRPIFSFLKSGKAQRIKVSSSENCGRRKHDFPWAGTQPSRYFLGWLGPFISVLLK